MKGHPMKLVFSNCVTLVLALFFMGSAVAQDEGRQRQRCRPDDPYCHNGVQAPPNVHPQRVQRHPPPPSFLREGPRWDREQWQDDPSHNKWSGQGARRGDRVPLDYRSKQYVVDDWQRHGLRRPPHGYHWVQNGGDYLLVAITTGIILELLLNY
jgi:Ni/Co efflux regulator RcnB